MPDVTFLSPNLNKRLWVGILKNVIPGCYFNIVTFVEIPRISKLHHRTNVVESKLKIGTIHLDHTPVKETTLWEVATKKTMKTS